MTHHEVDNAMAGVAAEMDRQGRMWKWLAHEIGVTPTTMSRWLAGRWAPGKDHRAAIARALGRSESDLFARPGSALSAVRRTEAARS